MNAIHYLTRVTRRVSLVEQELLILPEHPTSSPVFTGVVLIYLRLTDYHFGFVTLFLVKLHRLLYQLYMHALYGLLLDTGEGPVVQGLRDPQRVLGDGLREPSRW